ncbi:MAG: hypothetical protein GX638_13955 [Crenarchaeota archaeon]|nr:hypothetical protein [Thermoproteota archaeon]
MKVNVCVETKVNPTENNEKVKKALFNLFGDLPVEIKPVHNGQILAIQVCGQESLNYIRNILARDRIRDSSRKILRDSTKNDEIIFYLNKQVAFAGHVSFCEAEAESPLGPIKVSINCENPAELINWLAPRTIKS